MSGLGGNNVGRGLVTTVPMPFLLRDVEYRDVLAERALLCARHSCQCRIPSDLWSLCLRDLLAEHLGFRHLLLLGSTNKSLQQMVCWALNAKVSLWHQFCVKQSSTQVREMLEMAAQFGKTQFLQHLLRIPRCTSILQDCRKIVLVAIKNGNMAAVRVLVAAGARVNVSDRGGEMPLLKAIEQEDLVVAQALLEAKADVHSIQNGTTPLHMAAYHRDADMVQLLLNFGAPVNLKDTVTKATALHDACQGCDCRQHQQRGTQVLALLVRGGANSASRNKYDETPHGTATRYNNTAAIRMLWREVYPLHYACSKGRVKEVEDLLLDNIDVNSQDMDGRPALYLACAKGYVTVAKLVRSFFGFSYPPLGLSPLCLSLLRSSKRVHTRSPSISLTRTRSLSFA